MNIPRDLIYTKTHEWIRKDEDLLVIGITDFAQAQLSDLTYAELPSAGDPVSAGDEVAVVESVKAASDIYAPVAGRIEAVNDAVADHPELVNTDPYGEGWLFKIKPDDPSATGALLDADAYEDLVPDEDE
jgi:glycine cleavage system H protein